MELFAQSVGPFTVLQWCIGLVAFGVLLGMWNSYSASRGETGAHGKLSPAQCLSCGWKGNVSKFHRVCPKCGTGITRLERR